LLLAWHCFGFCEVRDEAEGDVRRGADKIRNF
jgi:hypothetical protein